MVTEWIIYFIGGRGAVQYIKGLGFIKKYRRSKEMPFFRLQRDGLVPHLFFKVPSLTITATLFTCVAPEDAPVDRVLVPRLDIQKVKCLRHHLVEGCAC